MFRQIIEQKFAIHPIGQGLFYSGIITLFERNKFKFVFDCGSKNARNCQDEVTQFRASELSPGSVLDMLVISHFDNDHVSHIKKLLDGGTKVKKLIMPFITFEERLFLALYNIVDPADIEDDDTPEDIARRIEDTFSVILNPVGTLLDNLRGGEVILIEGGSGHPDDNGSSEGTASLEPGSALTFDFEGRETPLTDEDLSELDMGSTDVNVKKVSDDHPAKLKAGGTRIMEFVFYRRKTAGDEKAFYANVKKEFIKHFGIGDTLVGAELLEAIKERVLSISSAEQVKSIFKKAKKGLKLTSDGRDIVDPNTTALCMLHKNLGAIKENWENEPHKRAHADVIAVSKPEGAHAGVIKTEYFSSLDDWRFYPRHYRLMRGMLQNTFPNVLLTSDSFIREVKEVKNFHKRYQRYWQDYWMFQVPHHGAARNANKELLSRIGATKYTFINYGINNKDDHPNERLIHDMSACGLSNRHFAINQHNGLEFTYILTEYTR